MRKTLLIITAVNLLLIFVFSACKKDKDENQNHNQDVEAILLDKNWKLTAFTINPSFDFGNGPTNDVFSIWDICEKDDLYIFKANSVFVWDEGATKCDAADPQQSTATWSYNKTSKLLTYCLGTTGACDSYSWTITDISETVFKATGSENIGGTNYNLQLSFTKQ